MSVRFAPTWTTEGYSKEASTRWTWQHPSEENARHWFNEYAQTQFEPKPRIWVRMLRNGSIVESYVSPTFELSDEEYDELTRQRYASEETQS